MVDYVLELLGEEADVEHVEHGAHRRDGEIGFQVLLGIPSECPYPVPGSNSQPAKSARKPVGSLCDDRETGPSAAVRLASDHLAFGINPSAVPKNASHRQGKIHRRAL